MGELSIDKLSWYQAATRNKSWQFTVTFSEWFCFFGFFMDLLVCVFLQAKVK